MFQWKNLFIRIFLLKLKSNENKRKWGKYIKDADHLAEELQKYACLCEKGNKGYKQRDQKENAWKAVKQFSIVFLWTIRDQAILWKVISFSSLLSLKGYLYK